MFVTAVIFKYFFGLAQNILGPVKGQGNNIFQMKDEKWHGMILVWRNTTKSISNIWQYFSIWWGESKNMEEIEFSQ